MEQKEITHHTAEASEVVSRFVKRQLRKIKCHKLEVRIEIIDPVISSIEANHKPTSIDKLEAIISTKYQNFGVDRKTCSIYDQYERKRRHSSRKKLFAKMYWLSFVPIIGVAGPLYAIDYTITGVDEINLVTNQLLPPILLISGLLFLVIRIRYGSWFILSDILLNHLLLIYLSWTISFDIIINPFFKSLSMIFLFAIIIESIKSIIRHYQKPSLFFFQYTLKTD